MGLSVASPRAGVRSHRAKKPEEAQQLTAESEAYFRSGNYAINHI
jgi:hypothetical protein